MIRGLYTSALGMTVQMKKMDVVSNNIANSNTSSFKRDIAVTQSFSEELTKRLNDPVNPIAAEFSPSIGKYGKGLFVDSVYTDFTAGNIISTGGAFDMAIAGSGFFAVSGTDVQGNDTENYTRDGSFTLSAERVLVTKDGRTVLGQNGPITIPDGILTISEKGEITVNDEIIDRIRIVDFENYNSLRKIGNNLYRATDETIQTASASSVLQGQLEASNVNSVKEMVSMISVSRAYESNQRLLQTHDQMLQKAVNEVGRR